MDNLDFIDKNSMCESFLIFSTIIHELDKHKLSNRLESNGKTESKINEYEKSDIGTDDFYKYL